MPLRTRRWEASPRSSCASSTRALNERVKGGSRAEPLRACIEQQWRGEGTTVSRAEAPSHDRGWALVSSANVRHASYAILTSLKRMRQH